MRLDRFIALNVVRPWCQAFRQPSAFVSTAHSEWAVPILMYHSISDDPEDGVPPYYQVNTSPGVFRRHVESLAGQGYRSLSLPSLVARLSETKDADAAEQPPTPHAPDRAVIITFDDGFRNFLTHAFPVLREFGFCATVFLPTQFIGESPRPFRPSGSRNACFPECLTWREVLELHRSGISFGSHTVSHPELVDLSWPQIRAELMDSRTELEQHLQSSVTAFCYPYAFPQVNKAFCTRFRGLLQETGYTSCTTTQIGRVRKGDDVFQLKRLPANSLDDHALFQAKLQGAYDWLATPQSIIKRAKSFRPR